MQKTWPNLKACRVLSLCPQSLTQAIFQQLFLSNFKSTEAAPILVC